MVCKSMHAVIIILHNVTTFFEIGWNGNADFHGFLNQFNQIWKKKKKQDNKDTKERMTKRKKTQ